MRLAKERKVRFRARFQCAEAAQPKWGSGSTALRKKLLNIDDTQSDVAAFPRKRKILTRLSHTGFAWCQWQLKIAHFVKCAP